jgi:SAM-dependent methyltransferase
VLVPEFFQRQVGPTDTVLDLGCGYGDFINHVRCGRKYGMDLNPEARRFLDAAVTFLEQDCSGQWPLGNASLQVIFTSNFFEHLSDRETLGRVLDEARRCLAPGGQLIAMGPNIKHLPGLYWEFWDHHLPLTENALKEALEMRGMEVTTCYGKFLPYTMVNRVEYPMLFVRLYLRLPLLWTIFGRQFLLIARKPA